MVRRRKSKIRVPILVIGMIIGFGMIVLSQTEIGLEAEASFGQLDLAGNNFPEIEILPTFFSDLLTSSNVIQDQETGEFLSNPDQPTSPLGIDALSVANFPTLEFARFDVDPETGVIQGAILLGKPDRSGFVKSVEGDCLTFESISQGTEFPMSFGEVDSAKGTTCYYGFAEWDISAIPDGFVARGISFKEKPQKFFPNWTEDNCVGQLSSLRFTLGICPRVANNCIIKLLKQPIDGIPKDRLMSELRGITLGYDSFTSQPVFDVYIAGGFWCKTSAEDQWSLGGRTERVLSGGRGTITQNLAMIEFDESQVGTGIRGTFGHRSGFSPPDETLTVIAYVDPVYGRPNSGCCYEMDQTHWGNTWSWSISGSSSPIICGVGFFLDGFTCKPLNCTRGFIVSGNSCIPLICQTGMEIDLDANECKLIICDVGRQLVGNECQQIVCPSGQNLIGSTCTPIQCSIGQELVGNSCFDIVCPVGRELIGSTCTQILCQTGSELIGNSCRQIVCGTGDRLEGNLCIQIQCPLGTELLGDQCNAITCNTGKELVGNSCLDITCPLGTILEGNNCNKIICRTGTILQANTCEQIICESGTNLIGNICTAIQCNVGESLEGNTCQQIICESGTELIANDCTPLNCLATEAIQGNSCVRVPLDCPSGTVERENVCVQFVPTLQATGGGGFNSLLILGFLTFGIFATGFVTQRIRRTS